MKATKNKVHAYSIGGNQQTILLRLTWADGDVNADQTVDVTDLQSVIYYALNDAKPAGVMYNFACSDTNGDEKINVSDIVGTVDHVLAYNPPAGARPLGASVSVCDDVIAAPAAAPNLLTLCGTDLLLTLSEPAAAIQLSVESSAARRPLVADELPAQFKVAMRESAGQVRIVIYSPSGDTLAPGEYRLLSALPDGATVTDAVLSDAEARHMGVSVIGTATTAVEQLSNSKLSNSKCFDLQGRPVGPWHSLPQGVYIINVNGQSVKIKK